MMHSKKADYLIQWKLYWSLQSNINNLNWMSSSIEALDALFKQCCSDWMREKTSKLAVIIEAKIAAFK